jgi:uncharacterized protein (DUF58 family)
MTAVPAAAGVVAPLAELIALRGQAAGFPLRHATGMSAGGRAGVRRGMGMDFAESRPYQPGDDVRHVDWRQTARHGRLYTKLYAEESERPVRLLVDLGASMRFGTRRVFKSVQAARLAAWLAWAAVAAGDRVGGLIWDGAAHRNFPPRGRLAGALAWLEGLAEASATPAQGTACDLAGMLGALGRGRLAGSLTVPIGDFAGLDDVAEARLAALARHTDLLLVHVYDPFELLPPPGHYRLDDGRRVLALRSDADRRAYGRAVAARREALRGLAGRLAVPWLSVSTADDPGRALAHALAGDGATALRAGSGGA